MRPGIDFPSADEQVLAFVARQGKGHITIARCPCCGYMEWRSQHPDKPDGHTVTALERCGACMEVAQRSPEFFSWVLGVVAQAQRDTLAAGVTAHGQDCGFYNASGYADCRCTCGVAPSDGGEHG